MNELYLKFFTIKLSQGDLYVQSQNIFTIIKQIDIEETLTLDLQLLLNIFSKDLTDNLLDLFLKSSDCDLNLRIISVFCSFYHLYPEKNDSILLKVVTTIKNETLIENTFQFLQFISTKYPILMIDLCEKKLIKVITEINSGNKELLEKSILILIQNLQNITKEILGSINQFINISDTANKFESNELFLKLLSASSIHCGLEIDVLLSEDLWIAILDNLVSTKPINRKRGMYWLNRLLNNLLEKGISNLSMKLADENFILMLKQDIISDILILIEALEEKQTHLITPTLSKFNNLIKFNNENLISIHWLLIIIEKASLHESTIILKWTFSQFLNLPVFLNCFTYNQLLTNFFINTLNNSNLYFSPESVSDKNGFFASETMKIFLNNLFDEFSHENNSTKLSNFLNLISSISWNTQALLFFAESFSEISSKNFNIQFLLKICYLCLSNLPTFDLKYRQCISSGFLIGFFNNHQIDSQLIIDYFKLFHTTFDINKIFISDKLLINLLNQKFQFSFAIEDFTKLLNLFHSMEKSSDLNFKTFSNKIACFSLFFMILLNTKLPKHIFIDFLKSLFKSINNSLMNPYANFDEILKSIICLKEFHLNGFFDKKEKFLELLNFEINENLSLIINTLSFFIQNNNSNNNDKESQQNYIELLQYFVKKFPDKIMKIFSNEMNGNSPLKLIIGANIDSDSQRKLVAKIDINFSENRNVLTSLDYEKLNLFSQNIDLFLEKFNNNNDIEKLFTIYLNLLDVSSSVECLIPVLNLIGSSLQYLVCNSISNVVNLIRSTWSSVLEFISNAQKFWKIYSLFIDRIFLQFLKTLYYVNDNIKEEIISCLTELIDFIFEIGENKFGLVYILGDKLHDFLIENQFSIENDLLDFYLELICKLVLFGPCHRRSLRFENKIDRYLSEKYHNRWNSKFVNKLAESSDRVSGILILSIANSNILSSKFHGKIIMKLSEIDKELLLSNRSCYKNYINNRLHRSRHRLFSVVLICLKMSIETIPKEFIDFIENWMLNSIEKETLSSIRHLAEWSLMLIYFQSKTRLEKLIELLRSTIDSKPAYVCSLISIARHLIQLDSLNTDIDNFIEQLILVILPLGSAQNYNVRLHSMSFINIIKNLEIIPKTKESISTIISSYINFMNRSSTGKNINKLSDNFWWAIFNPIDDVCLETVFHILPQLFDLVEEELISLDQFTMVSKPLKFYQIKFANQRSVWNGCKDSVWRVKTETFTDEHVQNENGIVDVQKKIQPWLTSRPDEDMLRELCGSTIPASDIVLVCSLLDKSTNIGGLARTSNIFGVGEFVVDNLRIVDDNNFKQLAVTADKWINMTEVSSKSLVAFISMKRMEGFEIVGIEQTANSVPLQSTVFERRTVLILGNEKEGIPSDLISHLDRCIEIPQLGQIRSLNVHVTGAIVLWEYMKQMKLNTNTE